MREAFENDRPDEAQRQRNSIGLALDAVSLSLGASLGVLQGVERTMGGDQGGGAASAILSTLDSLSANNQALEDSGSNQSSYAEEAQRAAEIEQNLDELETQLVDFRRIDAQVLVSPFRAEARSITNLELKSSDFFAPGVIILLLQHLAVTFAALSIVRERLSGAMELFRVAPISAIEALIGKYISYLFLGALLAAGISALVMMVLRVPMIGSWTNYSLVLLAVLFASLGAGFVLSLFAETTTQAVQYSMLLLLFSIFFSGFFLDLRLMWDNMRFLSYSIPATYGLRLLQEIMFRGNSIDPTLIAGLVGIGVLLFLLSWLLLRRQMRLY
jgi:ABC-2 type transport system permease protein